MKVPFSTQEMPSLQVPLEQNVPQSRERSRERTEQGKSLKKWLLFSLRLGFSVLLLVILMRSVSWSALLKKIHDFDDGEVLITLFIGMSGVVISAYQWQVLLDAERIRIDLRRLVNLYLVGIAFNHFLPTGMGGDVVKAYYSGKEHGNIAGAASAAVMARVTGFLGMVLLSFPAMVIWHSIFPRTVVTTYLLGCGALCAALVVAYVLVTFLSRLVPVSWNRWRILASVFKMGRALQLSLKRPRSVLVAVLFGVLFHLSACLNYYSFGLMLHLSVPFVFYLVAVPFVALVAFLPLSINGFGLREGAFVFILSTIHVPVTTALLLALLVDVQMLLFGGLGGIMYLLMGKVPSMERSQVPVIVPSEEVPA